jgi:hypothetical protein
VGAFTGLSEIATHVNLKSMRVKIQVAQSIRKSEAYGFFAPWQRQNHTWIPARESQE